MSFDNLRDVPVPYSNTRVFHLVQKLSTTYHCTNDDVNDWLKQNAKSGYDDLFSHFDEKGKVIGVVYRFVDPNEAMMFKLTWI
jgi:hypothetical protein